MVIPPIVSSKVLSITFYVQILGSLVSNKNLIHIFELLGIYTLSNSLTQVSLKLDRQKHLIHGRVNYQPSKPYEPYVVLMDCHVTLLQSFKFSSHLNSKFFIEKPISE